MTIPVSIIMSVTNRPQNLRNTLRGWSIINYPDFDLTVIDNGSGNPEIEILVGLFKDKLPITFVKEPAFMNINRVWNKYGKAARGEYIVYSMMDEVISHNDILQKMMDCSSEARTSIFTYFMNEQETIYMNTIDWFNDPTVIPKPRTTETSAGLLSHITGNFKKNWEWFGWFRDDEKGHLWLDQDIYLREKALGSKFYCRTPENVYCLHQSHPSAASPNNMRPGYHYKNEMQARLLEPAERDLA